MLRKLLFVGVSLFTITLLSAQNFENAIEDKLRSEVAEGNLNQEDVSDFEIDSYHYSKSTNTNNVYVLQRYQGIPIFNSIGVFAIRNQEVLHFTNSFENNLQNKINTTSASISPLEAINSAANQLGLESPTNLSLIDARSNSQFLFNKGEISFDDIPVKLVYQKNIDTNQLLLAWDLSIHAKNNNDWWSVRVDAQSGEIISTHNWTISCSQSHEHKTKTPTEKNIAFHNRSNSESAYESFSSATDGAIYNVYPIPVESPNHGQRSLEIDPADELASPFGWHDTDGIAGAEFTITRGNNVWAQEDRAGNNSAGYAPDGGDDLIFDFPLAFDAPPAVYEDAAITNLFYWNNVLHDVWYKYGFNEEAGNFQQTNYSDEGFGNDFVFADAQDGQGLNNASFGTPPDGNNPSMTMFLWSPSGPEGSPLSIESPATIAGDISGSQATFGPILTAVPITEDLVLIDDINSFGTDYLACGGFILNSSAITGKIAVVRRGECTFVTKVQEAQDAGAAAVIVVNNEGGTFNMGGTSTTINIPSIMISQVDGEALISELEDGVNINATLVNDGPYLIDGDFDNGIISHEFGHGVSNRLTGGRFQTNCLFNEEQMGEGWSDYMGLMMTMKSTDLGPNGRGYGTFAVSQPITGNGIRPTPYSTDTNVNPFTYDITNNTNLSLPHGMGYVWAQMLWDMTWDLIDEYGFDPNLYNGTGGNNIAMQLVTDGLKLQSCSPGFIDGRDAILMADELTNDGANKCLIWQAFADRGLGWSADQGDSNNRLDQVEAFDMPPVDELDCETFSNETFDADEFKIWPNPAGNFVNIQLNSTISGDVNIEIFNINGRRVASIQKEAAQEIRLNIDELNAGVYLVKVISNEANYTKKLLVK